VPFFQPDNVAYSDIKYQGSITQAIAAEWKQYTKGLPDGC
jgi:hypothetical protein